MEAERLKDEGCGGGQPGISGVQVSLFDWQRPARLVGLVESISVDPTKNH